MIENRTVAISKGQGCKNPIKSKLTLQFLKDSRVTLLKPNPQRRPSLEFELKLVKTEVDMDQNVCIFASERAGQKNFKQK